MGNQIDTNSECMPMIYLYAVELKEQQYDDAILNLLDQISKEKRERAKRYIKLMDRKRCIMGEILLQYLLWIHFRIRREEILFEYNEFGKPFLVKQKDIFFNISHSGEWIFCGIGDVPMGIDVEGGDCKFQSLAKSCFTVSENEYLKRLAPNHQKGAFYKIWTLKESYVKCVGKGLHIPFNSFYFDFTDEKIQLYVNGELEGNYSFQSQRLDEDYTMSYCICGHTYDICKDSLQKISLRELFQFAKLET